MVSLTRLSSHFIFIALVGFHTTVGEFVCRSQNGIFANYDECHSYYFCSSGESFLKLCPPGLLFNSIMKICDWPAYVSCTTKDVEMSPEPEYRLGIPSPDIACADQFRIKSSTDCNAFYTCIEGVAYKERCSNGLFFNFKTQNCDFPQNVECVTVEAGPSGPVCRTPGATSPNKQNCSTYWEQCSGRSILRTCDQGHHYSENLKQCIAPCAAKCDATATCDESSTVETRSMVPITTLPSTIPTTTTPRKPIFNCPEADSLFRNLNDCTSYWICTNKNPTLHHCSNGLHFSDQLKQCVEPCAAKCDSTAACKTDPSQCKESQFLGHEKDCNRFYYCSQGVWLQRSCPVGLHFNVNRSLCDFPCNAKCDKKVDCFTDPDLCRHNGLFPHVSECTKFYICDNGVTYIKYCPEGLHFDRALKICNWPCEAKCDQRMNCLTPSENKTSSNSFDDVCKGERFYARDGNCSQFYNCHQGKAFLEDCPSGLHWNKQKSLCDWPCNAKCDSNLKCEKPAEDDKEHPFITTSDVCKGREFYPHEKECTKFYHCAHGVAYLKDCPDDLHWSVARSRCEWPCVAKCDSTINCGNIGAINMSDNINEKGICNGGSEFLRWKDCTKFYHCDHAGRAHLKDCPAGLHWSQEQRRCDWPCEAKCDAKAICGPITPMDPLYPPENRSDICKENEFYPHENDCGKFYHCANRVAHLKLCPDNLHWSVERNRCEWNCNAKCDKTLKCTNTGENWIEPTLPNITRKDKCQNKEFYPHESDCTKFYYCDHGIAYLKVCPSVLHWSIERNRCEWPCLAQCDKEQTCETGNVHPVDPTLPVITRRDICKGEEFYAYKEECNKFYHCANGIAYLMVCPSNLHWSKQWNRCEWPCTAHCKQNLNCKVDDEAPEEPTLPVIKRNDICNGSEFYPHKTDCTKFYHCAHGIAYLKVCPSDLHWNVERNLCDYPCSAQCVKQNQCEKHVVDPVEPTLPVITKNDICKGKEFYAYEMDCTKFYHCANGLAYMKVCPSNLHWSIQRKRCEQPCLANCDLRLKCEGTAEEPVEPTLPVIKNNKICNGSEFYSHESDCSKFYHCAHGIGYLKVCPSVLHWSVGRNRCEWPCIAQCVKQGKCEGKMDDYEEPRLPVITRKDICKGKEFYQHETDCTKFYHCASGLAYLKLCPSNLHWSVERNRCEWPCIAQCDKTKEKCDNTWTHPVEPTLPVIIRRDICEDQEFYNHPTDCTKFYHCAHKLGYLKVCPANLHWNQQKNLCESPCSAKCNITVKCGKINDQTTETVLPTIKENSICKGSTRNYYPHKTDCNKFYQCAHGIGILKVCQANLHWSVELNQCEWPCTAKCDLNLKCSTEYYENDLTVRPVPKTQFLCPITSGLGLFSDPDNCKRFYHCSHGIAHHKWCPSDLHFNPRLMVCDWADRAGCAKTDVTIDNSTINFGNDEGTCSCECCLIPDEKDCQTFYLCLNMKLYRRKCSSGLLFNADIQTCDHSEHLKKKCDNVPTKEVEKVISTLSTCQRSGELLNHETNCNSFYHCDHGIPKLKTCPDDLHFSVALQRCEYPCVAKCEDRTECAKEQKDASETNNSSTRAIFTCPSYSGLYPDRNDCNKFFHCDHYKAHHKVCPSKLHFNPSLRVCDWPYRAGCINGQISKDPIGAIGDCSCECCLQADQHQCNKFTLCLHGKLYPGSCGDGLFFNPEEETCDVEEKVRHLCAKARPAIMNVCQCADCRLPHPTDCALYHQCSGGTANEEKCPAGQSFDRQTFKCDQTEKVECPVIGKTELCSKSGMFKSPKSCREFIICTHGKAYIEKCPATLEFNPDIKVCDYPKGKCN